MRKRISRSIAFDVGFLKWVDEHIRKTWTLRDRSHFIEVLIREYKERVEKEQAG
jgi:metal-responsive CopG/Arc/MetJ family transcriptional regulator